MTKEIVSISLGPSSRDYEFTTQMFGEEVHVRRFGVDGDVRRARELVAQFDFDGQVEAIGLEGMRVSFQVGRRAYVHQQMQHVADAAQITPVVDGLHLKNTLERWTVSQAARRERGLFNQKRIFVLSGVDHYAVAQVLGRFSPHLYFGDPILHLNLPFALRSFGQLQRYARLVLPVLCKAPYDRLSPWGPAVGSSPRVRRYFKRADIIVGSLGHLRRLSPGDLEGKIVIADSLAAADVQDLRARGVESLITCTPPLSDDHPFVGLATLEAILTSFLEGATDAARRTDDDYLNRIARWEPEPHITVLNEPPDVARFAFVIHPLRPENIFRHPILKYLRFLPHRPVEWAMAHIRPLYLSRITGVRSAATGKEVEGFLITLGGTPRELMRHKPGFTYRRLIVASRLAQQMGAKIMGLGAFTKVVGDAGMTVAYKSDIAITSGNSLTVAATLEAAKQAVLQMGGRIDQGRAVVIGATGSIGSVCSRLLAQAIQDVALVAPRPEKLIALKKTIEAETPGARVVIATDAGPHLGDADLVVTTTTAIGQKVIDVRKLKPGCVVCDVAMPPDVQEEDARLRPDVLVIESGEILLPGEPDFGFDIGLPPGVAYACLAEAALLAMEGRFENFTLGRNIEMDKVKEIYRLFKKHGLQLEGLRSFGRYVTEEEIARKRELADELRRHPEKLEALIAQAQAAETVPAAPGQRLKQVWPWAVVGAVVGAAAVGWWLWRQQDSQQAMLQAEAEYRAGQGRSCREFLVEHRDAFDIPGDGIYSK